MQKNEGVEINTFPNESYDKFISIMLIEKKKKIERILDLY